MHGYIPTLDQANRIHRDLAPSQAAYDLIHTHCLIVAVISQLLARRQNALFAEADTFPEDAPELTGAYDVQSLLASSGAFEASTGGAVIGGVAPKRRIDEDLVFLGGIVHDIGAYLVLKHDGSDGNPPKFDGPNYVLHGLRGYRYLLDQGVDESIAQFARNHTGVGLTREEVMSQGLAMPPDDYLPANLEQEVVMVADKYHSKSNPPKFLSVRAYAAKAARFGESNERKWFDMVIKYGIPDVVTLAERFHQRLV